MVRKFWKGWRIRRRRGTTRDRPATGLHSESLEPRVLFSADLPWVNPDASEVDLFEQSYEQSVAPVVATPQPIAPITQAERQNLVVIDPSFLAEQHDSADLIRSEYESAGFDVVVLTDTQGGIQALDSLLSSYQGLGSIDVLTTAQAEGVTLGSQAVGLNDVLNSSAVIARWADQLDAGSSIGFQAIALERFTNADHMANLLTTLVGSAVGFDAYTEANNLAATHPELQPRHEVVFVDTSVDGYQA